MPKYFSFRPALSLKGRKFKGLRGLAGKPFHPPLTDFPIVCYVLLAVFDLISFTKGNTSTVARDFYVSATHVVIAGAIVSLPTAVTGIWDWLKGTPWRTQAWRTINAHALLMLTVTALVVVNIVMRLSEWEQTRPDVGLLILSLVIAGVVSWGAVYGGALVYEYGFNVETAGDSPVWHESERDVFHHEEHPPAPTDA